MPVTEDRRIALLEAAHQHWGRDVAVTLMEMLPPSGWGDVATRQRLDALERDLDLRLQLVDQRIDALEMKLTARVDALDARLEARIDALEGRVEALHHDMHAEIARAEVRLVRWIVASGLAMVGTIAGLGGLVLALH